MCTDKVPLEILAATFYAGEKLHLPSSSRLSACRAEVVEMVLAHLNFGPFALAHANFGPFGPVAGYCSSIMAASGAIYLMWARNTKKWRPPDKDMPGTARAFVLLLCGAFLVIGFYFTSPKNAPWMVSALVAFALISLWFYLKYSSLIGSYGYKMTVPRKGSHQGAYEETLILGGTFLLPEAEEKRRQHNVGIQELLEGAKFDVDKLWSKPDLQSVRDKALRYFIAMLVLGTATLITAGFVMEVTVLKKDATTGAQTNNQPKTE